MPSLLSLTLSFLLVVLAALSGWSADVVVASGVHAGTEVIPPTGEAGVITTVTGADDSTVFASGSNVTLRATTQITFSLGFHALSGSTMRAMLVIPPTVMTAPITGITYTSASGGGTVSGDGNDPVIARGICWATATNPTIANAKTVDGSGVGTFVSALSGLAPGTIYYVRAYATNGKGTGYGGQVVFTTVALTAPVVTTSSPLTGITSMAATGGGNVTSDGGVAVSGRGLCWSTTANPTSANATVASGSGTGAFTGNLSGLAGSTTYHVRAYATNTVGTGYGADVTVTTSAPVVPTVTATTAASAITSVGASSGGTITSDGGAAVTARGICWSTTVNPTTATAKTTDGTGSGTFPSGLTGLIGSTLYHVRAYATNSAGTAYGPDVTFTTTAPVPPTLTTTPASGITAGEATAGGTITSDGGAAVTTRGVCWSTALNPTTADPKVANGSGVGTFTGNLTNLLGSTTYHIRAYATNSAGTSYGNDVTCTTSAPVVPTVVTTAITAITTVAAKSGGTIPSAGGSPVTAKGICWSTSANPDLTKSTTLNGSGTGGFSSDLSALAPGRVYHVRAYATNAIGTGYGADIAFTTTAVSPAQGGTSGGTVVTITGVNLAGVTAISFGGVAGTGITSNTATSVTVTAPAHAGGAFDLVVTATAGTVTLPGAFSYLTPQLLDGTSGAVAAYGLRRLRATYAGPLVQIRRSTDNAVAAWLPDATGWLSLTSQSTDALADAPTLGTWIGTANGFVATWYDQTVNATNATQATAANQPQLITAGQLSSQFGKAGVSFNGSSQRLQIPRVIDTDWTVTATVSTTQVLTGTSWWGDAGLLGGDVTGAVEDFGILFSNGRPGVGTGASEVRVVGTTAINTGKPTTVSWTRVSSSGAVALFTNGAATGTGTVATGAKTASTQLSIGSMAGTGGGTSFSGLLNELIIANMVLPTASRQAIETAQGSAFGSFPATPGLVLDTVGNAAASYSLRRVSTSANGPLVRIRRSTDGSLASWKADATGWLSLSSTSPDAIAGNPTLGTWIGTADGFVAAWYDQSGQGNHAVQSTLANQPLLITAGVLVTVNGKPTVSFNGSSQRLQIPRAIDTDWTVTTTATTTQALGGAAWWNDAGIIGGDVPGPLADFGLLYSNGFPGMAAGPTETRLLSSVAANTGLPAVVTWSRTSSSGAVALLVNGAQTASGTLSAGPKTASSQLSIGSLASTGGGTSFNGRISELMLYRTVLPTASRQAVEQAQGGGFLLPPTVTTTAISATTTTGTTTGGNVTAAGDAPVTARGVCWATTANPTTANSILAGGSGTGAFASVLTGLTPGTTYHVRAYATSAAGTSYGADLSVPVPAQVVTTVTPTAPVSVLQKSGSTTCTATAKDQFGTLITPSPAFTWSVTGVGSINATTGAYAAGTTPGNATITAAAGGKTGSITLRVNAPPTVTTVAKAVESIPNANWALTVQGADSDGGGTAALTYTWSAAPSAGVVFSAANGSTTGNSITATFATAGSYTLTATITDSNTATVTSTVSLTAVDRDQPPVITGITVPATVTGTTASVTVTATDDKPGLTYAWSATNGATVTNATSATATVTFVQPGSSTVSVMVSDTGGHAVPASGTTQVVATATDLRVTSAASSVWIGGKTILTAGLLDQFNQPLTTPATATWAVSGPASIAGLSALSATLTGATPGGTATATATLSSISRTLDILVRAESAPTVIDPSSPPSSPVALVPGGSIWVGTPLSSQAPGAFIATVDPGDGSGTFPLVPGVPAQIHYGQPGAYTVTYQDGTTTKSFTVYVIQVRFPVEDIVVLDTNARDVPVDVIPAAARSLVAFSATDSSVTVSSVGTGMHLGGSKGVRCTILAKTNVAPIQLIGQTDATICHIDADLKSLGVIQGVATTLQWGWTQTNSAANTNNIYGCPGFQLDATLVSSHDPTLVTPLTTGSRRVSTYPQEAAFGILRITPRISNATYEIVHGSQTVSLLLADTVSADVGTSVTRIIPVMRLAPGDPTIVPPPSSFGPFTAHLTTKQKGATVDLNAASTFMPTVKTLALDVAADWVVTTQSWGVKPTTVKVQADPAVVTALSDWQDRAQITSNGVFHSTVLSQNTDDLFPQIGPSQYASARTCFTSGFQDGLTGVTPFKLLTMPFTGHYFYMDVNNLHAYQISIPGMGAVGSFGFNFDATGATAENVYSVTANDGAGSHILTSTAYQIFQAVIGGSNALMTRGTPGNWAPNPSVEDQEPSAVMARVPGILSGVEVAAQIVYRPTGSSDSKLGYHPFLDQGLENPSDYRVPFTGGLFPDYWLDPQDPSSDAPHRSFSDAMQLYANSQKAKLTSTRPTSIILPVVGVEMSPYLDSVQTNVIQSNGALVSPLTFLGSVDARVKTDGKWSINVMKPGDIVVSPPATILEVPCSQTNSETKLCDDSLYNEDGNFLTPPDSLEYYRVTSLIPGEMPNFFSDWQFHSDVNNPYNTLFTYYPNYFLSEPGCTPLTIHVDGVSLSTNASSPVSTMVIQTDAWGNGNLGRSATVNVPPANLLLTKMPGNLGTMLAAGSAATLLNDDNPLTPSHAWTLGVEPASLKGIMTVKVQVAGAADRTAEVKRPLQVSPQAPAWKTVVPNAVAIDAMSGDVRFSRPVVRYTTADPGPDVTLTYNSLDGTKTGVGTGWRTNYDTRVVDGVWWVDEQGSWWSFGSIVPGPSAYLTTRTCVACPGVRLMTRAAELAPVAGSQADGFLTGETACVTPGDGRALWFDAKGFLVRVTFQRGGALTVTRDATTGDAVSVIDDKGRKEMLNVFSVLGEATAQTLNAQSTPEAPEAGTWTFAFANSGGIRRLTTIGWGSASQQVAFTYQVDVASDTSDDWKANRVLTYTFSGSGTGDSSLKSDVIYTTGTPNVTTIGLTGQSASLITWTFDQQGVLQKTKEQSLGGGIETVYTYGSTATAAPTQITLGGAVVEQSTYDTLGRLTQRTTSPGATAPALTESFAYTYSTAATVPLLPSSVTALVERSTIQGVTGTSGGTVDLTTRYAYTTAGTCSGLVAKRTDPDGAVTSWAYATDGRVSSWTDPRSKVTTVSALNTYGDPKTLTLPGTPARTQQQTIDKYGYTTSSQGFIGGATTGVANTSHHHEGKTTTPDGSSVTITTVSNDLPQTVVTAAKTAAGTVITTTVTTTYDMLGRPVLEQTTNRTDIATTYTLQAAATPGWRVTRKQGTEILADAWIDFAGRTRETYQRVTLVGGNAAAQAQTTVYTYSTTDGRLTSTAPPADTKTDVVSDFQGRILKTTQGAAITSRTINAVGWELTSTDVNGLITPTVYDAMGRVTYAKNPAGGWTWLTYDAAGNLTTTESSTGVKTSQEFDDAGILTATIDGFGRRTTQTISGTTAATITWKDPNLSAVTTTATLDGALRPTQQKVVGADSLAATTTITPGVLGDGSVTAPGRKPVVASVDSLGRPSTSKVTTTLATPDVLFGSTNGYDANDHVKSITRDDGLKQTFTIDPTTGETNVVSSTANTDTATPVMTITKRDARGRTLEWTDGDGFTSKQTFDVLGRLLTVTPPNGVTSTYAYTGGSDRVASITNAVDGIRSFTYHTLGGTTSVLRGTVQEQAATYDRDGRVLTTTTKGITTTTTYDPTTGAVATVTDPRGTTTYVPNARGLITRIDYPNNRSVQIAYDTNERPKKRTYSDGTYEQLTYDANGDVVTVRDRAGRTQTVTTRDGTGSPRLVTADTGEKRATDIAVRTGGGFATTTTETVGGTSRAATVTTNGSGSTVSTALPGQTAIVSSLTAGGQVATRSGLTYTRLDANTVVVKEGTTTQATITLQNGRVATVAFANGHTRQNTFTNGKLTTSKETVGSLSWTTSYTWGSDDRLSSRTTPFETESYVYNDKGFLSGWQRTGGYDASATYGFDGAGRRTTDSVISSPKAQQAVGFTTSTSPLQPILGTWAATGSAATGTGSVTSDALATMSAGNDPQTLVSATVVLPQPTSLGYREATLVVNGVLTNNVLVSWDEWRAVMTKTSTGITLTGVLVHVDGNGEKELGRTAAVTAPTAPNAILSLTQQSGGVVAAITPSGTGTLTTVSPLTVSSMTLAGRIGAAASTDSGTPVVTLKELRWTPAGVYRKRSYIFNGTDQLTSITEQTQTGTRTGTLAYDAAGNRTGLTWSDNVGSLVNTYDRWNRLASEKVGAAAASAITYIPGGVERLSRGSTTFTRDASGLLGITQGSTTTTYGVFGSLPLYENTGGTITTLAIDADRTIRGRVGKIGSSSPMFLSRLFTNPTGEVAGQLTARSTTQTAAAMMLMGAAAPTDVTIPSGYTWADSAVTDGLGWHGLWFDAGSKSYQMGHRTYSADTNSFDQRDPARAGDDWYRFASNDPVNRWDPSGLDDIDVQSDGDAYWVFTDPADEHEISRTRIGAVADLRWRQTEPDKTPSWFWGESKSLVEKTTPQSVLVWDQETTLGPVSASSLIRSLRSSDDSLGAMSFAGGPQIGDPLETMREWAHKVHLATDDPAFDTANPMSSILFYRGVTRNGAAEIADRANQAFMHGDGSPVMGVAPGMTGAEITGVVLEGAQALLAARSAMVRVAPPIQINAANRSILGSESLSRTRVDLSQSNRGMLVPEVDAWPGNRGFAGTPNPTTLQPGTVIDRYGYDGGSFVSPVGTPFPHRALPVETLKKPYSTFEVMKPINVQSGPIAPWFGQPGGGLQHELPDSVQSLIESGHLRRTP